MRFIYLEICFVTEKRWHFVICNWRWNVLTEGNVIQETYWWPNYLLKQNWKMKIHVNMGYFMYRKIVTEVICCWPRGQNRNDRAYVYYGQIVHVSNMQSKNGDGKCRQNEVIYSTWPCQSYVICQPDKAVWIWFRSLVSSTSDSQGIMSSTWYFFAIL